MEEKKQFPNIFIAAAVVGLSRLCSSDLNIHSLTSVDIERVFWKVFSTFFLSLYFMKKKRGKTHLPALSGSVYKLSTIF